MTPLALTLVLSLALGQAAPGPGQAAAPPPAGAAPAPVSGPALRALRLEPLPGGAFRATLDGQPVSGADLYRAALRPDLAARAEARAGNRTAALVVAGAALVGGPALGWVAFKAQGRSLQACVLASTGCEEQNAQARRDNRALERRGLAVGGAAGAAAAGLALWWWAAHPAIAPDRAEAEALVRDYEARRAGAAPAGEAPAPAAGRGDESGLRLLLQPVPGGLLAALGWRG